MMDVLKVILFCKWGRLGNERSELTNLFLFRIFSQNFIRGNAATNNTPNEGEKNHRGKVKEVEMFQYNTVRSIKK
jgi:hypothetical protein